MRTTIDRAGRIVVPKSLREAAQLEAGQEIEIGMVDGALRITHPPAAVDVAKREGVPVISARREQPPLEDDDVRDALENARR